jgi:hypothetical protein
MVASTFDFHFNVEQVEKLVELGAQAVELMVASSLTAAPS